MSELKKKIINEEKEGEVPSMTTTNGLDDEQRYSHV